MLRVNGLVNFGLLTHLLKMSKCELSLKVLQLANFSQITHSPTFGRAFTWLSFRRVASYSPTRNE